MWQPFRHCSRKSMYSINIVLVKIFRKNLARNILSLNYDFVDSS
jgi:hypothetical protein